MNQHSQQASHQPAAVAALSVTEELRATLRHALNPAEPRYTVFDRAMLGAASLFGGGAYRRMEHAVNQHYVPGVIADLDRFAGDLRREMGDEAMCGMRYATCGNENSEDVHRGTAEVYIV